MKVKDLFEAGVSLDHRERAKVFKDQTYKPGDQYDKGNPGHAEERAKREEAEKKRKVALKNYKPENYPVFDDEYKRRLFEPEIVKLLKDEVGAKEWDKMSELEQIEFHLEYIQGPPSKHHNHEKYSAAITKRALALQAKIKRV